MHDHMQGWRDVCIETSSWVMPAAMRALSCESSTKLIARGATASEGADDAPVIIVIPAPPLPALPLCTAFAESSR